MAGPVGRTHVIDHPLVQHKLTLMRSKETSTSKFRTLLREISTLLAYEVCRDFPTTNIEVETPIARTMAPVLDGKKLVLISILRAGNGLLDGMLDLIPSARVGHIGLYRDHKTLEPVEYYFKVPDSMAERDCIIVDPMLATGNSAAAAVARIKQTGPRDQVRVPVDRARGLESVSRRPPRRAGLHGRDRRAAQREELHRPRARRCRRPDVRHQVACSHYSPGRYAPETCRVGCSRHE